ncbi:hypothetical protein HRR83_004319 [Exophiala dermatitidis]|uniref:Uncharacterized protein n=2 Tax=Exophiala dermatitidis TaxID=5970 RepID=H6BQG7_EXODN|nr:uncharacterized protein HMPREF1120_02728 [Exophiala dermatitidis NIH/UT8656]KAJ4511643.1 hypothetical protein HRR73_006218 [Exophiala dermatitidis]EHY54560.1 hypothetical protein HMPREF1120_02728 [Exophiala dermatitidis NIH/UT8656]KAJ4521376.1 hypothetical protein HRR74_003199 [Exophiala dermatitidis]KAJ4542048.1 hypothetical protein HRR77_005935 [Exophiala dermatitidis]KAJ4544814.1 hypothetical protein HRR76_002852 [Exophiala dermatitidis]
MRRESRQESDDNGGCMTQMYIFKHRLGIGIDRSAKRQHIHRSGYSVPILPNLAAEVFVLTLLVGNGVQTVWTNPGHTTVDPFLAVLMFCTCSGSFSYTVQSLP